MFLMSRRIIHLKTHLLGVIQLCCFVKKKIKQETPLKILFPAQVLLLPFLLSINSSRLPPVHISHPDKSHLIAWANTRADFPGLSRFLLYKSGVILPGKPDSITQQSSLNISCFSILARPEPKKPSWFRLIISNAVCKGMLILCCIPEGHLSDP